MDNIASGFLLDPYSRKARLAPVLIAALPLALGVLAWFPDGFSGASLLVATIVWSGGATLAAEFGRERGRKLQPQLFASWGGKPSIQRLRHRGESNKVILARRHRQLASLLPDVHLPSPDEENQNRKAADEVYEACSAFLIERTRERSKFPLVFTENRSYGFRRNLLGLRAFGIVASLGGLASGILSVWQSLRLGQTVAPTSVIATIGCAVLLLLMVRVVTTDWVKASADAYADQLLAACDSLEPANTRGT